MQRINLGGLYYIGYTVHPLTQLTPDITYKNAWEYLYPAKLAVEFVEKLDKKLNLSVSRSVYEELKAAIAEISDKHSAEDTVMDYGMYLRLKGTAERLETILAAEFQVINTYAVAQAMAYDVRTLIERGEEVIPEPLRAFLPEIAKKDLREAARCLAYRLNTAVGFHILRAVEATLMEYFGLLSITAPTRPSERNLGNYITLLKNAGVDDKILLPLDQMRAFHRNELMHPERSLDETESSGLFEASKAALTAMLMDIKARTPAPTPAASTTV